MNFLKAPVTYFLLVVLLAVVAFSIYKAKYSMEVVKDYSINEPSLTNKILIATQGSDFKDSLTASIIQSLKSDSIYIEVIDVSLLSSFDVKRWNAVIVVHTWEYGEAQFDAYQFAKTSVFDERIIVVTTSGNGQEKMLGIDAISSASVIEEIPQITKEVNVKIMALLQ